MKILYTVKEYAKKNDISTTAVYKKLDTFLESVKYNNKIFVVEEKNLEEYVEATKRNKECIEKFKEQRAEVKRLEALLKS